MVSCGQLVTLRPCSDSGMPVHHQTGTHLPETWEGIRDTASPLRPCSLWRAGLFSTPLQPHIFHHGLPTCAQIFKYFLSFHLFSFALLFYLLRQLVPLCSPFVHLPPPALPAENLPEGQQHNRHQNSLLLLFLLSLTTQLSAFNKRR